MIIPPLKIHRKQLRICCYVAVDVHETHRVQLYHWNSKNFSTLQSDKIPELALFLFKHSTPEQWHELKVASSVFTSDVMCFKTSTAPCLRPRFQVQLWNTLHYWRRGYKQVKMKVMAFVFSSPELKWSWNFEWKPPIGKSNSMAQVYILFLFCVLEPYHLINAESLALNTFQNKILLIK